MDRVDDEADERSTAGRELRAPSLMRLGRYRLVREIASGGMATVNLAVAEGLDKLVALKIIHPHLAQEESFVRMFLDEARLASAISHRNVCNVFDFGETDGRYYIAMDYLAGQSVKDVLRRLKKTDLQMEPLRLAVYLAYMIAEACEGLHAAHELHGPDGQLLHVVHRDVSPHNLFVTYDGNVSVVDFGIARASDRVQSTATGVLKGKFSYMAPEQMRQVEIDRRADIWALGVVLWESLTLQRLFVRSSQADTVMSVMMDRLRPPSEVKADIPKELDQITMRAVARNPAHRFATAREMGRELMRFCRESGVLVGPIEIEHFMERLFAQELEESKALMRRAKQSTLESGSWMELTPSGFARAPLRSGMIERGQWTGGDRSMSGVGGPTQSASMRHHGLAPSQAAPRVEAQRTARPDKGKLRRLALAAALCTAAVGAGAWLAVLQRQPLRMAEVQPVGPGGDRVGSVASGEPAGTVPPSALSPAEPAPAEQLPAPPPEPTEPVPEAPRATTESPRPEPRARRAARASAANGASGSAARGPDPAATPERSASARPAPEPDLELPTPTAPAPVAEAPAAAPEPEPVVPTAPVRVTPPPPKPAPPPPPPPPPERLTANAGIADLDVEGSLGSGIVSRMLGRVTPALRGCYESAARAAGRNEFAPLSMSFVIDEVGAVRSVATGKHGLPALPGCAAAALRRMRSERVPDVGTSKVRLNVTFTK